MKLSTIKHGYLYNYSLKPKDVVHQGKEVGHGKLLVDIVEGIYLCACKPIHPEHHAKRLQQLVERTMQSIEHGHRHIRKEYLLNIQHRIAQIHDTSLFKTPTSKIKISPAMCATTQTTNAPSCLIPPPLGRGLSNCGNTCYANSVLNLALLTPAFRGTLEHRSSPLAIALRDVQTALHHRPDWDKPLSCDEGSLFVLLRELKKIFPNIASHEPQDAEEFLHCLLDHIGYPPNDFTIEEQLQTGQIIRKQDRCSIIPLHIGNLHERFENGSLQHLLDNSIEQREDGIECQTKLSLTHAIAPKLLFIHLIRYNSTLKKDQRPILIPQDIKLDRVQESSFPYRLHGAVLHNEGHYSMIERTDSGWLCHNDSQVSAIPPKTALQEINRHGVLFSYEEGA